MTDGEAFYDVDVAPVLLDLARKCQNAGVSFLAVAEWQPGEQGRTCSLSPNSGFAIRLAEVAAKSNGNVDALILAIIRYAEEHGHSSMFLQQLGVPPIPQGRPN